MIQGSSQGLRLSNNSRCTFFVRVVVAAAGGGGGDAVLLLLMIAIWPFPVILSVPVHPQTVPRRRIGNTPPGPREDQAGNTRRKYHDNTTTPTTGTGNTRPGKQANVLPTVVVEGAQESAQAQVFMGIGHIILPYYLGGKFIFN